LDDDAGNFFFKIRSDRGMVGDDIVLLTRIFGEIVELDWLIDPVANRLPLAKAGRLNRLDRKAGSSHATHDETVILGHDLEC
jgi:hypothetical protein